MAKRFLVIVTVENEEELRSESNIDNIEEAVEAVDYQPRL